MTLLPLARIYSLILDKIVSCLNKLRGGRCLMILLSGYRSAKLTVPHTPQRVQWGEKAKRISQSLPGRQGSQESKPHEPASSTALHD